MWNFKGYLWNSIQNILPIHWKVWFLYKIEILRALIRLKSSYAFLKRPPYLVWCSWSRSVFPWVTLLQPPELSEWDPPLHEQTWERKNRSKSQCGPVIMQLIFSLNRHNRCCMACLTPVKVRHRGETIWYWHDTISAGSQSGGKV